MVATLLRLRLRITLHTLRSEVWRIVLLVTGLVWALASAPTLLLAMVWLGGQAPDVVHDVLVVGGVVLLTGWVVVPLLVPGLDDSLDVTRFTTFGLRGRHLVPGMLAAAYVGLPTLLTLAAAAAPTIAWLRPGEPGAARLGPVLMAAGLAPVVATTCVLASRLATGLAARVLGSRRSREITAVGGVLVVGLAIPAVVTVGALGLDGALEAVPEVAAVLGWTPLAAGWAAPAALAQGDLLGAAGRAVVALATVALAAWAWSVLLDRHLISPPSRGGETRRGGDVMLRVRAGGRFTARLSAGRPAVLAALAVARRAGRYWTADPRYLSAMVGGIALPVVIVVLAGTVVDAPAALSLSVALLMGGTIGWGRHNDTAYDGSAFWMHVVAAVPGWADRAGRTLAVLVWALPATVLVGVAGALVAGRADLTPAAVGGGLGVLLTGLAVSAVSSAGLSYPVPAAGANPYSAQAGALGASLVAQLVTSAATVILAAPVLVAFAAALWWSSGMAWVTLGVGVLGGGVVLVLAVVLGGRVHDARAVRQLVRLAR